MMIPRKIAGLEFDELEHRYRYRGVALPSVTAILPKNPGYEFVEPATMEYARQRGTAVDRAIQFWLEGELDDESLDPAIIPYVRGFGAFLLESNWRTIAVQPQMCCSRLGVAGTADGVGWVNGRRTVCDWKVTAQLPQSVSMQVGAYARLWDACYPEEPIHMGAALHLRPDGTYRFVHIDTTIWGARFVRRLHEWKEGAV